MAHRRRGLRSMKALAKFGRSPWEKFYEIAISPPVPGGSSVRT